MITSRASRAKKQQNQIFLSIIGAISIVLFIIMLLTAVKIAFAWSPETFCSTESNGSIPEYLSCMSYFQNLTNKNYSTITINQTINNTQYVYVNGSTNIDPDDFVKTNEFELLPLKYYSRTEVDSKIDGLKDLYDLNLEKRDIELFSNFKDELKSGGWLEQIIEYKPNVSLEGYALKEELYQLESDLRIQNSNDSEPIPMSYVLIIIVLVVVGAFLYLKSSGGGRRDEVAPPGTIPAYIEDERIRSKVLLEKQKELIAKQQAELSEVNEKIYKLMEMARSAEENQQTGRVK